MEIQIQNSKASSLNFPKRKSRNKCEEKWNDSENQKIFLDEQEFYIDESGIDVIAKFKLPPYLKEKIVRGEVNINGTFFPEETNRELEDLLDTQEKLLLNGKTAQQVDFDKLLETGLLRL